MKHFSRAAAASLISTPFEGSGSPRPPTAAQRHNAERRPFVDTIVTAGRAR